MNFWDQNFSASGYKYGTTPNAFLLEQAHRFKPGGDVLVPGDGEGRNGVWLAQQGHRVTAMDGSVVGLQKALALATERGVALLTVLDDLTDWTPEPASFDAVLLVFVHLPVAIRAGAHKRLAAALRPGGYLLYEGFHPEQLKHRSGGPKDPAMLMTLDMLRDDFGDLLEEQVTWQGDVVLNEGPGHQGMAHVVRGVWQQR